MGLPLSLISRQERSFATGSHELQAPEGLRAVRDSRLKQERQPDRHISSSLSCGGMGGRLPQAPWRLPTPEGGHRASLYSTGLERGQGPPGWARCWCPSDGQHSGTICRTKECIQTLPQHWYRILSTERADAWTCLSSWKRPFTQILSRYRVGRAPRLHRVRRRGSREGQPNGGKETGHTTPASREPRL